MSNLMLIVYTENWCVESALIVIDDGARWRLLNEPRMTTLYSALSDPATFSVTTLYMNVLSALVFFTVSREKVWSPSAVTCRPGLISSSLRHHEAFGVGAPQVLTLSTRDLPASSFWVALIARAATSYTHIIRSFYDTLKL